MKQQKWWYAALLASTVVAAAPVAIVQSMQAQQQAYCLGGQGAEDMCSRFSLRLPQYQSAWLNRMVRQDVRAALGVAATEQTQRWAPLLRRQARANTQQEDGFVSTQQVDVSVQPQGSDERWAAYTLTRYEYNKGAAHGSTAVLEKVWDVPGQHALLLRDLLVHDASAAVRLHELAKAAAVAEFVAHAGMSEAEAQSQLDGEMFHFTLTDNWRPVRGGLVLVYQQYEIAPYAYGIPELFIPVAQLRGVVQPALLRRLQNWPRPLKNSVAE